MSLSGCFRAIVVQELQLAFRRWGDLASPLIFYALIATLFPLALAPEKAVLQNLGPAVLWVGALLAMLLSLNALFRTDIEDGTLEQLVLSPHPLTLAVLAKTFAHWMLHGLPIVILAPIMAVAYYLPAEAVRILCLSLLLGTPTLSLLGAAGAALTAGIRQTGGLLALIVLPLTLPVLMFGARATDLAAAGEAVDGPLLLLGALLLLALSLLPFASSAAIRISLD